MEMTKGVQQHADADQYVHYVKVSLKSWPLMVTWSGICLDFRTSAEHSVTKQGHGFNALST